MGQRICPNCGHVENEYTYFCTECGCKTVEKNSIMIPATQSASVPAKIVTEKKSVEEDIDVTEKKVLFTEPQNVEISTETMNIDFYEKDSCTSQLKNEMLDNTKPNKEIINKPGKINPVVTGMVAVIVFLLIMVIVLVTRNNKDDENIVDNRQLDEQTITQERQQNQQTGQPVANNIANSEIENASADEEQVVEDRVAEEKSLDNYVSNEFEIRGDVVEDYSKNLDPGYYRYYDSGISDFNFWYPTELYNSVMVNEEANQNEYGYNLKTVCFSGSNGSELIYSITQRTDDLSISDMSDYVYTVETSVLCEPQDIVNFRKDDHGKVIVTGWDSEYHNKAIYDMLRIEENYVIQMKVSFPDYTSNEDKVQKAYVTECYYRLCGFSDSSSPTRNYAEYLEANP